VADSKTKTTRKKRRTRKMNKCAECGNEKPIEETLCLHCWCLQNNVACCGEEIEA
jgi:hypothetical protein